MKVKIVLTIAIILLAFVLLACAGDGPPNPDGRCIAPSPCASYVNHSSAPGLDSV